MHHSPGSKIARANALLSSSFKASAFTSLKPCMQLSWNLKGTEKRAWKNKLKVENTKTLTSRSIGSSFGTVTSGGSSSSIWDDSCSSSTATVSSLLSTCSSLSSGAASSHSSVSCSVSWYSYDIKNNNIFSTSQPWIIYPNKNANTAHCLAFY